MTDRWRGASVDTIDDDEKRRGDVSGASVDDVVGIIGETTEILVGVGAQDRACHIEVEPCFDDGKIQAGDIWTSSVPAFRIEQGSSRRSTHQLEDVEASIPGMTDDIGTGVQDVLDEIAGQRSIVSDDTYLGISTREQIIDGVLQAFALIRAALAFVGMDAMPVENVGFDGDIGPPVKIGVDTRKHGQDTLHHRAYDALRTTGIGDTEGLGDGFGRPAPAEEQYCAS